MEWLLGGLILAGGAVWGWGKVQLKKQQALEARAAAAVSAGGTDVLDVCRRAIDGAERIHGRRSPGTAYSWSLLASHFQQASEWKQAISAWRFALRYAASAETEEWRGFRASGHQSLALCYVEVGKLEKASEQLDLSELLDRGEEGTDLADTTALYRARIARRHGQLDRAEASVLRLVEQRRGRTRRGGAYRSSRQARPPGSASSEPLDAVLGLAYWELMTVLSEQGRHDEARLWRIASMTAAWSETNWSDGYQQTAALEAQDLMLEGDYETALAHWDPLTRTEDRDLELEARANSGLCAEQLGRSDEAENHYARAIELAKDHEGAEELLTWLHRTLATLLCRRQPMDSVQSFRMAEQNDGMSATELSCLDAETYATALWLSGEREAAVRVMVQRSESEATPARITADSVDELLVWAFWNVGRGRIGDAARLEARVAELFSDVAPRPHALANHTILRSTLLGYQGKFGEAEALNATMRPTLLEDRRLLVHLDWSTAALQLDRGHHRQARATSKEALQTASTAELEQRAIAGLRVLCARSTLATRAEDDARAIREQIALVLPHLAPLDSERFGVLLLDAGLAAFRDELETAESTLKQAVDVSLRLFGFAPIARQRLADTCLRRGQLDAAEREIHEALREADGIYSLEHPLVAECKSTLGRVRIAQGNADQGRELLSSALAIFEQHGHQSAESMRAELEQARGLGPR